VLGIPLLVTRHVARRSRYRRRRHHGPRRDRTVHGGWVVRRGGRDGLLTAKGLRRGWYGGKRTLNVCRRGWTLALDTRDPLMPSRSASWLHSTSTPSVWRSLLLLLNIAVNVSVVTRHSLHIASIKRVYCLWRMKSRPRGALAWCRPTATRRRTDFIVVGLGHSRRHRSALNVDTLERRPTGTRLRVRTRLYTHAVVTKINVCSKPSLSSFPFSSVVPFSV